MIGRGDVDLPVLDRITVLGVLGRQPADPIEQERQFTLVAADVEHDKHRRAQIGWQRRDQRPQRLNPSDRSADHDECWYCWLGFHSR